MAKSRARWGRRIKSGGKGHKPHDKRKRESARPGGNTKIGARRVHIVRCLGGMYKFRALRLDTGCFAWASEKCTRKTRIVDTVFNPAGNEMVRTKTLCKGAIIAIDAQPYRQWYENHYALPLPRRKGVELTEEEQARLDKTEGGKLPEVYEARQKMAGIDPNVSEQFQAGKLLARICSRPGQHGYADGYILEGKELEFYLRKIRAKKHNK